MRCASSTPRRSAENARSSPAGPVSIFARLPAAYRSRARTIRKLRSRLARGGALHPPCVLHGWLAVRDPRRASEIEPNDTYRVLRALEIALAGPPKTIAPAAALGDAGIPFVSVWLDVPIEVLEARIERRVDAMLAAGFVEEARRIGARCRRRRRRGLSPSAWPISTGCSPAESYDRRLSAPRGAMRSVSAPGFEGRRTAFESMRPMLDAACRNDREHCGERLGWTEIPQA